MIDVDRVHDVLMSRVGGKGCGRTYAMLVEALGLSDFDVEDVYIFCGNNNLAEYTKQMAYDIAMEMELIIHRDPQPYNQLTVNRVVYHFEARDTTHNQIRDDNVYCYDHYYFDQSKPCAFGYELRGYKEYFAEHNPRICGKETLDFIKENKK